MQLVVTIYEETLDAAFGAIRALNTADHDMVELRAERLGSVDLTVLRAATTKPIILTHRGMPVSDETIAKAIEAGIDFVDVEWRDDLRLDAPRDRIVLSHHDYEGMSGDLQVMRSYRCAHVKLAVTPKTLDDNLRLLQGLRWGAGAPAGEGAGAPLSTVIGMGERGLYSRILAPFLGSELAFVGNAAPGQLSLEKALQIYGRGKVHADHVFAIAGNPAGHSLSPGFHNPRFREKGVSAAYTIASFETFAEIAEAFDRGELRGMSITAPFKQDAFAYAERIDAHIRGNARECGAINTLVRLRDGCVVADNTDVDGFEALIGTPKRVAIVGAGGTARAARLAAKRAGADVTIFNRSARDFPTEPLEKLRDFDGDLVIDTLPVEIDLPPVRAIRASYTKDPTTGLALFHAQAARQNELFIEALT